MSGTRHFTHHNQPSCLEIKVIIKDFICELFLVNLIGRSEFSWHVGFVSHVVVVCPIFGCRVEDMVLLMVLILHFRTGTTPHLMACGGFAWCERRSWGRSLDVWFHVTGLRLFTWWQKTDLSREIAGNVISQMHAALPLSARRSWICGAREQMASYGFVNCALLYLLLWIACSVFSPVNTWFYNRFIGFYFSKHCRLGGIFQWFRCWLSRVKCCSCFCVLARAGALWGPSLVRGRHQRTWPPPGAAGQLLVRGCMLQSGLQRVSMAKGKTPVCCLCPRFIYFSPVQFKSRNKIVPELGAVSIHVWNVRDIWWRTYLRAFVMPFCLWSLRL